MSPTDVRRGAIWWAELPEPHGAASGVRRPVVIVQSDHFNGSAIRTVVVVILTSNLRIGDAPGNVRIAARESGLRDDSVANVSQLATIDRRLLIDSVAQVPPRVMRAIDEGLRLVLGL